MSIDLPKPIAPIFAAAPAAKMLPYSCQAGERGGLPPNVIFTEPPTGAATPYLGGAIVAPIRHSRNRNRRRRPAGGASGSLGCRSARRRPAKG